MSISPTIKYTDARGYEYVETSDWLKQVCALLPCFEALQWPDYASNVIRDVIDGQNVVIQLWKGWCPKIFEDFPGGIGAEVGVYRTVLERALPASLPLLTPMRWPVSPRSPSLATSSSGGPSLSSARPSNSR